MRGRLEAMLKAMEDAQLEPVIIEDLVKFGEDRGLREGMSRGRQEGKREGRLVEDREMLRRVLAVRKLPLSPELNSRIDTCRHLGTLRRWLEQAVLAESATDALR